ncbi:MAG: type I 3-dehydroquinate dehydratase [Syntrophus sp. (in: bacteria)]
MICASLVAGTMEMALEKMTTGFRHADLLELRIDLIADLDLPALVKGKTGPVLITNRRREEGGGFRGTEEERILLLCEAIHLKAEYVDIEVATDDGLARQVLGAAAGQGGHTKIIVSFHDFNTTPTEGALRRIWGACRERGGDIVKIVTHARCSEDNLRVLSLIPYSRKRGQDIIAFSMGEQGRISRIMAPLLGSYLAFAALDKGEEAAPGQMTVEEMKQVLNIITLRNKE